MRQAFFGKLDQVLHRGSLPSGASTKSLWQDLKRDITLIPEVPDANPLASFGHLFGGYDARYYGYLWSEVYSAALFEEFKVVGFDENGHPKDPAIGRRYRQHILAPGLTHDSSEGIRAFLGKDPTPDPFIRSIGLSD